jgi:hypothetical protein
VYARVFIDYKEVPPPQDLFVDNKS